MTLNKLQIRAKILPVLSDLRADTSLNVDSFIFKVKDLKDIEDKKAIFEIVCKELSRDIEDKYIDVLRAMLIELLQKDLVEEYTMEVLKSPNQPDMLKYRLIQLLKTLGNNMDYQTFFEYLEDAEKIINYDTEKLLEYAVINPETQIDFLDFLAALPKDDKPLLVHSLAEDYNEDNLANILNPVLYGDFPKDTLLATVGILGETKSSLAIDSLEFLHEITDDDEVRTACKKNLNLLRLSGATREKADKFYKLIMHDSTPYKCYSCVPDGHYNQGLIFSRKRSDGILMMFALVISKKYGIVDSFGFFRLTDAEFERIAMRFSRDDLMFKISPQYMKYLINNAFALTKSRRETMKYEFTCWLSLMADIEPMEQTEEDWVKENIKVIDLNQKIINLLYDSEYLDKWFFTVKDNRDFKELIDNYIKQENLTFEYIEKTVEDSFDKIWNEKTEKLFTDNIITTSYLFGIADFKDYSKILYSILFNDELKKKMQMDIIKKSVYGYLFNLKQNQKEFKFPANIFRSKKDEKENEIDIKTVDKLIKEIEEKWVTQ